MLINGFIVWCWCKFHTGQSQIAFFPPLLSLLILWLLIFQLFKFQRLALKYGTTQLCSAPPFVPLTEFSDLFLNNYGYSWEATSPLWTVMIFFKICFSNTILFFLATPHGLWDISFQTRDWTQNFGSQSAHPYSLDHQGIPKYDPLMSLPATICGYALLTDDWNEKICMDPPNLNCKWIKKQNKKITPDQILVKKNCIRPSKTGMGNFIQSYCNRGERREQSLKSTLLRQMVGGPLISGAD